MMSGSGRSTTRPWGGMGHPPPACLTQQPDPARRPSASPHRRADGTPHRGHCMPIDKKCEHAETPWFQNFAVFCPLCIVRVTGVCQTHSEVGHLVVNRGHTAPVTLILCHCDVKRPGVCDQGLFFVCDPKFKNMTRRAWTVRPTLDEWTREP
jgi:hypothetical protein